jgi:hypothetical protein
VLWVVGFAFVGACEDITGLSRLQIADGSVEDAADVSVIDGSSDAPSSDVSVDTGSDTNPGPFCQTLTSPYAFCADFDEGMINQVYVGGMLTTWAVSSPNPPSLSSLEQFSGSASALCDGLKHEGFPATLSGTPTNVTVRVALRVDQAGMGSAAAVITVFVDTTHAAQIVLEPMIATGFEVDAREIDDAPDGSTPTYLHPVMAEMTGSWIELELGVSELSMTVSIGGAVPQMFPRVETGPFQTSPSVLVQMACSGTDWTAYLDNLVIISQN